MNTGPSKLLKCPICDKEVRARGMDAHLRLMHGKRVEQFKAKERPTQLELGINGTETPNFTRKGWKHKRKRYSRQEAELSLADILLCFGAAWVLKGIAEQINKQNTAGK